MARQGAKGQPPAARHPSLESPPPRASATTLDYFYAATYQRAPGLTGCEAWLSQPEPTVSSNDSHSLGEMSLQSADQLQTVEVGWTVDLGLNGDRAPHLFVFHWVNGAATCYNACGWQQVSSTRYPGMPLTLTAIPQQFVCAYFGEAWWIWYQSEWIGNFPATLWTKPTFATGGIVQWYGEVAAIWSPHSQMGNGLFATQAGAAVMEQQGVLLDGGLPDGGVRAAAAQIGLVTWPAAYDIAQDSPSSFTYGGPGETVPDGGKTKWDASIQPVGGPGDGDAGEIDAGNPDFSQDSGTHSPSPSAGCGAANSSPVAWFTVLVCVSVAAGLLRSRRARAGR